VTYEQWESQVPWQIREDPIWKVEAYRLGLFLSDLSRLDVVLVYKHKVMRINADQLYRAASNISSNVTEGYSRSSPADRARFYEYALGSGRETRDWYYKVRGSLREAVVEHRLDLSTQLIALLVTMIVNERKRAGRIKKRSSDAEN